MYQPADMSVWTGRDDTPEEGAAAPPLPLTAAEWGVLLLCCALPGEEKPLSLPQFQELGRRVRALFRSSSGGKKGCGAYSRLRSRPIRAASAFLASSFPARMPSTASTMGISTP